MRLRRRIRYVGEILLAYLGLAVLPYLPRRFILKLARGLGALAFHVSVRPRRVAMVNVKLVFGDRLSIEDKRRLVENAYRTFALVLLDLFWFARCTRERVAKYVRFDSSCETFFKTKPSVSVTGHIGNWEILGQAVALRDPPFAAVAAPLNNRAVDWLLNRLRRRVGMRVAHRRGAMRAAMKTLNEGGRVGLLLDQNVTPRDGGKFVEFFGVPAPMSTAAEKLALKRGLPLTFIFCIPKEDGFYECHSPPPMTVERGCLQPGGITQAIADVLEDAIRQTPDHWLWMYKRWRLIPADEPREKYPFYAEKNGGSV